MQIDKIVNSLLKGIDDQKTGHNQYGVDVAFAREQMEYIVPIINFTLAMIMTIIIMLYSIIVCIEILYIAIPTFRPFIESDESYAESGVRGITNKGKKMVAQHIRDAKRAVETAAMTGQNPMMIYLKLKIRQAILVAIALYLTINIETLFKIVESLVMPMINLGLFG